MQADGEHLPFPDGVFDVVYCVATLHHALDLTLMVKEMARVARRGGVVAGLNEGTKGVRQSSENPDQEAEKALGINEHVHTIWAYVYSFSRAGLVVRRLERADGWPPVPYGRALSTDSEGRPVARRAGAPHRRAVLRRLDLRAEARVRATFVYPNSRAR